MRRRPKHSEGSRAEEPLGEGTAVSPKNLILIEVGEVTVILPLNRLRSTQHPTTQPLLQELFRQVPRQRGMQSWKWPQL